MDEDTEYLKLPLEERMVHKLWKARLSAYEETKKLFGQVSSHIFSGFLLPGSQSKLIN